VECVKLRSLAMHAYAIGLMLSAFMRVLSNSAMRIARATPGRKSPRNRAARK